MSGGNILNWANRLDRVKNPVGGRIYTQVAGDVEPQGSSLLSDLEFAGYTVDEKTANYTIVAEDAGKIIDMAADAKVITLPATVVGSTYIIRNAGTSDGAAIITIAPAAADQFIGLGITEADDKDLINTKLTALIGDYVMLFGNGTTGWVIQRARGIWVREA